jgi:hypothetical protein
MVSFPIYVRDDAGHVTLYPSLEKMQGYMEAIDVENGDYEAWDVAGSVLELGVGKPKSEWIKITQSDRTLSQDDFSKIRAKAVPYQDPEPLHRILGRWVGLVKG